MKTNPVSKFTLSILCVLAVMCSVRAQTKTTLTVQADKPIAEIQPTMWGVFLEDINFGADGGLYAELVKNKSFEFDMPLMGWSEAKTDRFSNNLQSGAVTIINRGNLPTPFEKEQKADAINPRFARVTVNNAQDYALVNEGFLEWVSRKELPIRSRFMQSLLGKF